MNDNPHPATLERFLRNLDPFEQVVLNHLRLGIIFTERAVAFHAYSDDIGDARTFLRISEHLGLVTRLSVKGYVDRYTAGPHLDTAMLEQDETSNGPSDQQ